MTKESEQIRRLTRTLPTIHSVLHSFNVTKRSSGYKLNRIGDNIPPCLTSLDIEKDSDTSVTHLT